MAKQKMGKRRRRIAQELNILLKTLPQFTDYTILNQNNSLALCRNNKNAIFYTQQLIQIGDVFEIRPDISDVLRYQTIENEKQCLKKLIEKYEKERNEQKAKCQMTSTIINNYLNDANFNMIDLENSQLNIGDKTHNLKIDGCKLQQHIKNEQIYNALCLVTNTTKKQHIDIDKHLKSSIDQKYLDETKKIVEADNHLQNIITKIDLCDTLLTNDVVAFIKQFKDEKQNKVFNNIIKYPKIKSRQDDAYAITYWVGNLYNIQFISLEKDPYQPKIKINEKEIDNLNNIIKFAKTVSVVKLDFCKKYRSMQQQHEIAIRDIIKEKKAGKYGETIAKQALHPGLSLTPAPNYDLEYCYKNNKTIITDLETPEQMTSWINICRQDFKQSELAVASKIENAIKNIDDRLTDPLNHAILILVRDTHSKGLRSLTDILKGSKCAAIYENKYDKHPSYGKLKDYKREIIENMINKLVEMDLIEESNYINKYNVYCTSYEITEKISMQLNVAIKKPPIDNIIDTANNISLKNSIIRLQKLKQIKIEHLTPPMVQIESDSDLQKVIAFFKTAKCAIDSEDALILYFADAISPKWSPFFMLNSQLETGKAAKRLKSMAELLPLKGETP